MIVSQPAVSSVQSILTLRMSGAARFVSSVNCLKFSRLQSLSSLQLIDSSGFHIICAFYDVISMNYERNNFKICRPNVHERWVDIYDKTNQFHFGLLI